MTAVSGVASPVARIWSAKIAKRFDLEIIWSFGDSERNRESMIARAIRPGLECDYNLCAFPTSVFTVRVSV